MIERKQSDLLPLNFMIAVILNPISPHTIS